MGHIRDQVGALGRLNNKRVRKAVDMRTMLGPHAISPIVAQCLSSSASKIEPGSTLIFGAYLKTRSVDDAVDFIFNASADQTLLSNLLNALAIGVD